MNVGQLNLVPRKIKKVLKTKKNKTMRNLYTIAPLSSPPPPFTFWGATQGSWDICGMYAGNAGESGWSQIFVENIIHQVITDYAICIPYCEFLDLYFPEIITFRLQLTYYQFYQMVWRAAEAFSFSIYMPMSGDCSTVNDLYRASSNGPKFSYYSFILRAF